MGDTAAQPKMMNHSSAVLIEIGSTAIPTTPITGRTQAAIDRRQRCSNDRTCDHLNSDENGHRQQRHGDQEDQNRITLDSKQPQQRRGDMNMLLCDTDGTDKPAQWHATFEATVTSIGESVNVETIAIMEDMQ